MESRSPHSTPPSAQQQNARSRDESSNTVSSWLTFPFSNPGFTSTQSSASVSSFADEMKMLPAGHQETSQNFWSPDLLRTDSAGSLKADAWMDARFPGFCEFEKADVRGEIARQEKSPEPEEESEANVKIVRFDHNKPALVGVGAYFERLSDGTFKVSRLLPHSPAAECGEIRVGDILKRVNSVQVTGRPMHDLSKMVLGTVGSEVEMEFSRRSEDGKAVPFIVLLARQRPAEPVEALSNKIQLAGPSLGSASPSTRVWASQQW